VAPDAQILADPAPGRRFLLAQPPQLPGAASGEDAASAARSDMERLFGGKVYLEVFVRVARGWADDDAQLKRFGY